MSFDKYKKFYNRLFTLSYDPIGNSPGCPHSPYFSGPGTGNTFVRQMPLFCLFGKVKKFLSLNTLKNGKNGWNLMSSI